MDYTLLKEELTGLTELCLSLPPKFQEKCFDVLINRLVRDLKDEPTGQERGQIRKPDERSRVALVHEVLVEQFLLDFGLDIDNLRGILAIADGGRQVQIRRSPPAGRKAKQQIDWSLLLALKNLVQEGKLAFRPGDVRTACIDSASYDRSNWAANYQRSKQYFADDPVRSPEVRLSPSGREALAQLIRSYASSK